MTDDELIAQVIAGTLPRIKDIRDAVSKEGDEELRRQIADGHWPELVGLPLGPPSPTMEEATTRIVWGAPLTDMAVQMLWAILSEAGGGVFIVNERRVAAACAAMDDGELKDATGIPDAHRRTVLDRMAEAFVELVRTRGPIDIAIDGTPIRLVAGT